MLRTFFEQEKIEYYTPLSPDAITLWDREKYARTEAQIGKIRSVVVFLIPYNAGQKTTNLSVYAQVKDYHLYLRELSACLDAFLKEKEMQAVCLHLKIILCYTSPSRYSSRVIPFL